MLEAIHGTNGAGAIMEKEVADVTMTYAIRINQRNFGYTISVIFHLLTLNILNRPKIIRLFPSAKASTGWKFIVMQLINPIIIMPFYVKHLAAGF